MPDKEKFPEQNEPDKIHGTTDHSDEQEKYLRDAGKIEDLPEQKEIPKMKSGNSKSDNPNNND